MKTIETVLCLIDSAKERATSDNLVGVAKDNRTYYYGNGGSERVEVYRVEYDMTNVACDAVRLYHYETLMAEVELWSHGAELRHVYGESRSDADSVNTFLAEFGIAERYTFKPASGGFQEAV